MKRTILTLALVLPIFLGFRCAAAERKSELSLAADAAASLKIIESARSGKSVIVSDLSKNDKGELLHAENKLAAGYYRLHALLALAPLNDPMVAGMELKISAGSESRTIHAIQFLKSDEFIDVALDFPCTAPRSAPISFEWSFESEAARHARAASHSKNIKAHDTLSDNGESENDPLNEIPGSLADAKQTRFRLVGAGIHLEVLPVQLEVRSEKVVYKPGEKGHVAVTAHNLSATAAKLNLKVQLQSGFDRVLDLNDGSIEVAAGKTAEWKGEFDTKELRWGAEIHAIATQNPLAPIDVRDVFAVSENPWAVASIAAAGSGTFIPSSMDEARAQARKWRAQGYTGFEAFFWAPCDMLDFTPKTETFFGCQGGYPSTITGTKNIIQACHEEGLIATVYANLYCGGGAPGLELMRKHPEWFGNASFKTFTLSDWDLLGCQQKMTSGKIRAPGVGWCFDQINLDPAPGLFEYHAQQLVDSHKMFGWDGVRYDSFSSRYWSVKAIAQIRAKLEKDAPGFLFGYNTEPQNDDRCLASDGMYRGGSMAMVEYVRVSANALGFFDELTRCRDKVWDYGGHLGPIATPVPRDKNGPPIPRDDVYCSSFLLASGSHPYYHLNENSDFPKCALRYSEAIYDNRLRPLKEPEKLITFSPDPHFLRWQKLVRTVSLGENKQRLVMSLLNIPETLKFFAEPSLYVLPPVRNLSISVKLPDGAKISGAWALSASPTAAHKKLPCKIENGAAVLTVPEIQYFSVIVLDFESTTALPTVRAMKELTDSYIQDWRVIGPFPSDLELAGFDKVYPPEEKIDLNGAYPGIDGATVKWLSTGRKGLSGDIVDLRRLLNFTGLSACGYAYTTIQSDRDRTATMYTKSDDGIAVWLNGEQVLSKRVSREYGGFDEDATPVKLKKGTNVVLVKVVEKWLYWLLNVRFANEDGSPLREGVVYGLENSQ